MTNVSRSQYEEGSFSHSLKKKGKGKKIKFVGGEPLLYKGLEDLIEFSRDCGISQIGITTNGIGLGTRVLELKKKGSQLINKLCED